MTPTPKSSSISNVPFKIYISPFTVSKCAARSIKNMNIMNDDGDQEDWR